MRVWCSLLVVAPLAGLQEEFNRSTKQLVRLMRAMSG
jgi:hypothetical protein